jgi:hypothetical protein
VATTLATTAEKAGGMVEEGNVGIFGTDYISI